MTPTATPEERDALAAEYALGVLDGAELAEARSLAGADPDFRASVARWNGRLAPMLDDVTSVDPPATLWPALAARLFPTPTGGNVVQLRRRVTVWRTATGAATAIAASLALVLLIHPQPTPQPQPQQAAQAIPMIAALANPAGTKLVANWSPADRMLVVAAAADMPVDAAHSHELWVIPANGKPRSLGVMPSRRHMMMQIPAPLSAEFADGATLAVTLEPTGGSPTGDPTGPILVSGRLERA